MKKQYFLLFLLCSMIISTTFCADEPQLSYWQQFKNWISGGASYAQQTAKIPYDWAREFVAGLTPIQREALKGALGGIGAIGGIAGVYSGKVSPQEALVAAGGSAMVVGMVGPLMDSSAQLSQMVKSIKKEIEGLSKQQKIEKLEKIQKKSAPGGKNPNEIKLNAVGIVLAEIAKEK